MFKRDFAILSDQVYFEKTLFKERRINDKKDIFFHPRQNYILIGDAYRYNIDEE